MSDYAGRGASGFADGVRVIASVRRYCIVVTPLLALAAGRERNGAAQIVPGAPRDPGSV